MEHGNKKEFHGKFHRGQLLRVLVFVDLGSINIGGIAIVLEGHLVHRAVLCLEALEQPLEMIL